jgi:hypothetical protein
MAAWSIPEAADGSTNRLIADDKEVDDPDHTSFAAAQVAAPGVVVEVALGSTPEESEVINIKETTIVIA